MKRLFVFAAGLAACLAQAQTAEEQRIQAGLDKLRADNSIFLEMNGSETVAGTTTQFKTQIWWQAEYDTDGRQTLKLQLLQRENNVLVQRIVGNGEALYNYDLKRREYSVTQYGGYGGGARPERYQRDLLAFSNGVAKGQGLWGMKLLRELYGDAALVYRSWMPGVRAIQLPDSTVNDPVWRDRTYTGSAAIDYIMYDGSPRRTIVYELVDDPPSDIYRLSRLFFNERSKVGSKDRLVEWDMKPFKLINSDYRDFLPYSYSDVKGWRPVVGPSPVKTSG